MNYHTKLGAHKLLIFYVCRITISPTDYPPKTIKRNWIKSLKQKRTTIRMLEIFIMLIFLFTFDYLYKH